MICPAMKVYLFFVCAVFALAVVLALSCAIFSGSKPAQKPLTCKAEIESDKGKMSSNFGVELELWTKNNWRY